MRTALVIGLGWLGGCGVPPPADWTPLDPSDPVGESDVETETEGPEPTGISVLLLDDGSAGDQVAEALREQGHTVTEAGRFWEWPGTRLVRHDVVVMLQGTLDARVLSVAADEALVNFVAAGRGLVRTELAVTQSRIDAMAIDDALPVTGRGGDPAVQEWHVLERGHDLVEGVGERWTETGFSAQVRAAAGATVVAATQGGANPLLTFKRAGPDGGMVVHVNHDLRASGPQLSDAVLRILSNAVTFSAP